MPLLIVLAVVLTAMAAGAVYADETEHTVTFEMPDGAVLATQQVPHGGYVDISKIPVPPTPPGAVFLGWGDVTMQINEDTVFTASFEYETIQYMVRYFADDRVTLMHTELVNSGEAAKYDVIPTKSDSGRYSYEFERWSADLSKVTSDMDVYPIFKVTERKCEVRFFDYDRTLLYTAQVTYGDSLTDFPESPVREPTIGYTYEFACWSITPNGNSPASFDDITDTKFVYAFYQPTLATYTVSFIENGSVISTIEADYNSQLDTSVMLDMKEGALIKMYRDAALTRELSVGFTVIGDINVYVKEVPGHYQSERDEQGRVIGGSIVVSHDSSTIGSLQTQPYQICDISQFPSGTVAVLDHASLELLRERLGDDAILCISLPRGSMTITASVLCALSDGHDVSMSIGNGPSSVKITSALKKISYSSYLNFSIKVNNRSVTELKGSAQLSFPLDVEDGASPKAWSVSSKGVLTEMESSYSGGRISFSSDLIQYFVLGDDGQGGKSETEKVVLPYGTAEYEVSGSGNDYQAEDGPQSKLISLKGDMKGNVLFVPSSFDNRPLTMISSNAFADIVDADAIVIPVTVRTFYWLDWSCTARDVYFLGDCPEFIGEAPSYVTIHRMSDRGGWEDGAEVHDRYLYNGSVGKDPFSFRYIIIQDKAYVDRYISGSYIVLPRSVMADGHEYLLSYVGDAAFMRSDNPSFSEIYRLEYSSYSLDTVEMPDTISEILSFAFRGSSVKTVYLPGSVVHIGDGAFRNCISLTPVILPDSLLYIGNDAFLACSSKSFSRISVPASVEVIGSSAFYGCSGLTNVSLDCIITVIPGSCFAQCSSLTNITIPETVRTIGPSAFYNCSNLLYIDLMNTETVGTSAFQCAGRPSSLECVVFGEPLRDLGRNSFANCMDLAELEAYCNMPPGMADAFAGVDLDSLQYYATSDVAESWSQYSVELLDEPEPGPDHTMTYIVVGMIVFFIIAGALSLKYRTKLE
jgi:hypothetical protein